MLRQLFPRDVLLEENVGYEPLPAHIDKGHFELMILTIAANARDALRIVQGAGPADETAQQHVFEPFLRTKPGVSGLGLAVAYTLETRANGDIVLYSAPRHGTIFRIRLPSATPAD